jgi:hypothetical protein
VSGVIEKCEVASNQQVVFEFARRTHGVLQKATEIRVRSSPAAFRDIRADRARRAARLARKPESFAVRILRGDIVDYQRYLVALLLNLQIAEVLHLYS